MNIYHLLFQTYFATLAMVLISQLSHKVLLDPFFVAVISLGFFFLILETCLVYLTAFGWSFQKTQKHWVGKAQILGLLFTALLFVIKERQSAFLAASAAIFSWQIYHKFYFEKFYPKTPFWQVLLIFLPLFLVGLAILQLSLEGDRFLDFSDYGWAFYFYTVFVASRYLSLYKRVAFTSFSLLLVFLGVFLFSFVPLIFLTLAFVPLIWFFPFQQDSVSETAFLFAYLAAPLVWLSIF